MFTRRSIMAASTPLLAVAGGGVAAAADTSPIAGLFATLPSSPVSAGVDRIQTSGHSAPGVGAAAYVDAGSETLPDWGRGVWWQQTGDGRRFKLDAPVGLTPQMFGARGDGAFDDTAAIEAAFSYAGGQPVHGPAGTYVITRPIVISLRSSGAFAAGPKFVGSGVGVTVFDNRVSGAPMLSIDSDVDHGSGFKGVLGVELADFTITRSASSVSGQTAIHLRTCYNVKLRQCHIIGMQGDGIVVSCTYGDNDASNCVSLEQVRVENCAGWGVRIGDPGHNEVSFTSLDQVFIQGCGTASSSPLPTSGGFSFAGQILSLRNSGFTINQNVAFYVPGQAGLAADIDIDGVDFENNLGRHIYVRGVSGFRGTFQLYSNDQHTIATGVEFDGSSNFITHVELDNIKVRAAAGNSPCTMFKIGGANTVLHQCRVRSVNWDNYDYAGQTRFEGWRFDPVARTCQFVVETETYCTLKAWNGQGSVMPLRLRKAVAGDTPSSTGEWIAYQIPPQGVLASNRGLSPNTVYFAYLFDVGNNVVSPAAIELSTTAPSVDAASGYMVKTGDPTCLFVGGVTTNAAGQFNKTGNGWLNADRVAASQLPGFMWLDAANRLRVKADRPASDLDGAVVGK